MDHAMRAQPRREADRARQARDREGAREHQREAECKAEEVCDPKIAQARRGEAAAHARAAGSIATPRSSS